MRCIYIYRDVVYIYIYIYLFRNSSYFHKVVLLLEKSTFLPYECKFVSVEVHHETSEVDDVSHIDVNVYHFMPVEHAAQFMGGVRSKELNHLKQ
jgi:hypothetical protein